MDDPRGVAPIVFVVDDDPEMRVAIDGVLSQAGLQVRSFSSAEDFLQIAIPGDVPRCLLLELRLPGLSGLGLQQRLLKEGISISIVFHTGFGSVATAVQAIRGGAVDYLEKPLRVHALLDALKRALDIDAQALLHRNKLDSFRKRLDSLSRREREVYQLLVAGNTNKQIGAALGIGIPTVTKHRARTLRKLKVRNVIQLITLVQMCEADADGQTRSTDPWKP
jgi:FixJ family two-component response regulator